VRGRLGVAVDRVLLYGAGGVAWINASDNLTGSAFGITANIASLSDTAVGFAAGGGVEIG
jgi:outer membrane immunogenic protein